MKAKYPKFGAYVVLHNAETNGYCWRECIRNALEFCDKVYILNANSSDADTDAIYKEFSDHTANIVMKNSENKWDMNDKAIVGRMKQEARQMVKEEYCVYLDADEILHVNNPAVLTDMILNNSQADVYAIPYFTFFGSPYQIANFKDAENFWRWKVFRNLPHIGHGIHAKARQYNDQGKLYMDKAISDGCEIINLDTLEIMPSMMFMPPQYVEAGNIYRTTPTTMKEKSLISVMFSECLNEFPIVCWHYGWVNFKEKAQNALAYWTKTQAYKDGDEHSQLFDGLCSKVEGEIWIDGGGCQEAKIKEWSEIDTISLNVREHPQIIKPKIAMQMKPKVLTVSLSNSGGFGVPKWNHTLKEALTQYDVQNFAFDEHVSNAPANANEIQKSQSFTKWIHDRRHDHESLVIFADGFWAATYQGPAKVVSVIHGLWSHPDRDKWDDGLIEERKQLFDYQIDYYKQAKKIGHTLICVSPFIHKILEKEHGIESILIPNAVDLDFWDKVNITTLEKDKPLILHGITSVNKGSDILQQIENHPLIKDRFDIGSIDEIAAHAGVPKAVAFKAADVAFLPTKWEASSYLLLECLANNLPIAAYRAGILNDSSQKRMDSIGVIVDNYDVDTFAQAIVDAYENRLQYLCGRLFLQENEMTTATWNDRMKQLIFEVL
jgi:glycosyltransferase involved in cell wall biosynthesis